MNTHIQSQNEMVLLACTNFEKQLRETQPTIFILVSHSVSFISNRKVYMLQFNV